MLNKVILMGRLTADPVLRHTQSDKPVSSFTLAVERRYKPDGTREADFIDIVCWNKTAEFTATYFTKGLLVAVDGRLQQRNWEDKEGNKRTSYEVVADEVHFAEKKQDGATAPKAQTAKPSSKAKPIAVENEDDESDGELPF